MGEEAHWDPTIRGAVERLYDIFRRYPPGSDFCTYCYTADEIDYITSTSVRDIDEDTARTLLWETGDHWESADVYRHFVPRILEVLAPPYSVSDIYPGHLFEVLQYHDFSTWPPDEKKAVISFLEAVTPFVEHAVSDEWTDSYKGLLLLNSWTSGPAKTIDLPASAESLRMALQWGRQPAGAPHTHHEIVAWCAELDEAELSRNDPVGARPVLDIAADVQELWKYWLSQNYKIWDLHIVDWREMRMPLEWFDTWLSQLDTGDPAKGKGFSFLVLVLVLAFLTVGTVVTSAFLLAA
jgi:hypothetical protein